MNRILSKEFSTYLMRDENILWTGESKKSDDSTTIAALPEFSSFLGIRRKNFFYFFLILGVAFFIVWFTFLNNFNFGFFSIIPIFIGLCMFSLFIYIFIPLGKTTKNINNVFNPASQGKAIYALTNKRMLIKIGNTNKNLDSICLEQINSTRFMEHENNLSSLILIGIINRNTKNRTQSRITILGMIQGVENGHQLYNLLQNLTTIVV